MKRERKTTTTTTTVRPIITTWVDEANVITLESLKANREVVIDEIKEVIRATRATCTVKEVMIDLASKVDATKKQVAYDLIVAIVEKLEDDRLENHNSAKANEWMQARHRIAVGMPQRNDHAIVNAYKG